MEDGTIVKYVMLHEVVGSKQILCTIWNVKNVNDDKDDEHHL